MNTSGQVKGAMGLAEALAGIDVNALGEAELRVVARQLMTFVELAVARMAALETEVQLLKDEINRLKGEQGKPTFKPRGGSQAPKDHSSERERRTEKPWTKGAKNAGLKIDRTEVAETTPPGLPEDAEFKGYDEVLIQDIVFRTDNVLFRRKKWYSASERKTYVAPLPTGYEGAFGPGIKTLVLVLYHRTGTSEPAISDLLADRGIQISAGQVSNLLTQKLEPFHAERAEVVEAGLGSTTYQHIDDTKTPVNGVGQHCVVVCNPLFSAYATVEKKDRQSVIDVLRGGRPRCYLLNETALELVALMGLSAIRQVQLATLPHDVPWSETELMGLLDTHLAGLGKTQTRWILDALSIAAYRGDPDWPVLKTLICDDAPQWTLITDLLSLCWVHEGRHFKKMTPFFTHHKLILEKFQTQFWDYYRELRAYRAHPTNEDATRLSAAFDELFSTETGYAAVDQRLPLIRAKKANLLLVLDYPELELHNNPAELVARARVRKRDVSFGPRSKAGVRAWDTFMTLAATAKKLDVSFFHYITDRITGRAEIPRLADLISQRAPVPNPQPAAT